MWLWLSDESFVRRRHRAKGNARQKERHHRIEQRFVLAVAPAREKVDAGDGDDHDHAIQVMHNAAHRSETIERHHNADDRLHDVETFAEGEHPEHVAIHAAATPTPQTIHANDEAEDETGNEESVVKENQSG